MTSIRPTSISLPIALTLALASVASADDNHYQNYLVGERAVGLGGAFTAISNDSSGAYYNPAGLAEVPYSSLSLSAAVYGFASEAIDVDEVDAHLGGRTFINYPTTSAWIQLLRKGDAKTGAGRMQAAISLITPKSVARRRRIAYEGAAGQVAGERYDLLEVEVAEEDTLWIGLSYAWKLHRRVSVGATLFTTVRTGIYQIYDLLLRRLYDEALDEDYDRQAMGQRIDAKLRHIGMVGVFGAIVTLTERLRLGVSFRTPLAQLHGNIKLNTMVVEPDDSGFTMRSIDEEETFNDRDPFKVTLGVAYFKDRHYGLSLDFSIYGPQAEYEIVEAVDLPMKKKLLWQLNVGAEYYLLSMLPVRAGFFTNLSSLDSCSEAELCNDTFADPVDRFGLAASVGYEIKRATLTLGWTYNFGSHDYQIEGLTITDSRSFMVLMLGGSFRF